MPARERHKTQYKGVFYVEGLGRDGKPEKIYYCYFRKDGKQYEEKCGRSREDGMTAARANQIRAQRILGARPSRKEIREQEAAEKAALADRWTVDRLWEEYKHQRTIKGLVYDESRFKSYIQPAFGDKEPSGILPLDVDRVRLQMQKAGKSPQTIKLTLALLKRICRFGRKKRLCEGLSFDLELPKVFNEVTEDLTAEQLENLMGTLEKEKHTVAGQMMTMVLFSGLRRGEMLKLRWEDVDLERELITLRDPKGGRDQVLPMNEGARDLFESIGPKTGGLVWPGLEGKTRHDVARQARRIAKAAGLPKVFRPLHGLRHVYASGLVSNGVELHVVQKLLTHKSPTVTMRYAHLRDETLRKAIGVADGIVNGARKNGNKVVKLPVKKGDMI